MQNMTETTAIRLSGQYFLVNANPSEPSITLRINRVGVAIVRWAATGNIGHGYSNSRIHSVRSNQRKGICRRRESRLVFSPCFQPNMVSQFLSVSHLGDIH